MSKPVRPAKATLPERCDAAPLDAAGEALLEEEEEGEVDVVVPFSVRFPPVPAVDEGVTLLVAFEEAFLKAARVLSPD